MWRALQHTVRAQWRDACILARESRTALVLFSLVLFGGTLALHSFYIHPETQERLAFEQALYATFALIFFEIVLPFPQVWYLQILFFAIPILGLAAIAEGLFRFGSALLNKQERGQNSVRRPSLRPSLPRPRCASTPAMPSTWARPCSI